MKRKKILVLLSAYNGEKYIEQQINSILKQKDVEIKLLIRDDGSSDNTLGVIKRVSQQNNRITIIKGENIGFVKSFTALVIEAYKYYDYDYYAFADQDDIWHLNKLSVASSKLEGLDESTPNMISSNCNLVDSNGNFLKKLRNYSIHYKIGNVLYGACLQGCSMVFNRKALELYATHPTENTYHDVWMLFICVYFGCFIYHSEPLFDYRIHNNNAIGISKPQKKGLVKRICSSFHGNRDIKKLNAAKEFKLKFQENLSSIENDALLAYINYPNSLKSKCKLLFGEIFSYPKTEFKNKIINKINIILNKL